MATPDLLPSLRAFLEANTSYDVFNEELPEDQPQTMPRQCVVLKEAGGYGLGSRSFLTIMTNRVTVFCYGQTPYAARAVRRDVHSVLKNMRAQILVGTDSDMIKILSAIENSGPMSLREPETRWPYTLSIWTVMARELEIAS